MVADLSTLDPKIADKIKKLLNKSNSAKEIGNLEEAEAFAAKVSEMLMQYNIDLAAVEGHELADKNPVIQEYIDLDENQGRHEAGWLEKLYGWIGYYNLCKVIILNSKKKERHKYDQGFIAIIGRKHNIDLVKYLCSNLEYQVRTICSATYRKYQGETKINTFKRGFFRGAVEGIAEKLARMRSEQTKQVQTMALIKFNDKAVDTFVQKEYPRLGSVKVTRLSGEDARQLGKIAGLGMNVNLGLGGSSNNSKRLN